MESKREKVDLLDKYSKKAEENKKAVEEKADQKKKAELEKKVIEPSSRAVPTAPKRSAAEVGPDSSASTTSVGKENRTIVSQSPKGTHPATSDKLNRWLERVGPASPKACSEVSGASQSASSHSATASSSVSIVSDPKGNLDLQSVRTVLRPGGPPTTVLEKKAPTPRIQNESRSPYPSPKPVFGTPFQELQDGQGWRKIDFDSGEYEGEFSDKKPHGFGRILWQSGIAYHGEFSAQNFHGKGTFFFDNGDRANSTSEARAARFEGDFVDHKPSGEGILVVGDKRYRVVYDGTKKFSDGAVPTLQEDAPGEVIEKESRVTVVGISKGIKTLPFGLGDYRHCKAVEGKLAMALPFRANKPLLNAEQLGGKIVMVQRGGCSFAKKLRYCQKAGALAMIVLGCDNQTKYNQVFQVHEGDPKDDDDEYEPGEDCSRVKCRIPLAFCLGIHEGVLRPGAFVRLRFFEGAPGTPPGWLIGCIFIHPQTVHPDMTPEESRKLLERTMQPDSRGDVEDFLLERKKERSMETLRLEEDLRGRQNNATTQFADKEFMKGATVVGAGAGEADPVDSVLDTVALCLSPECLVLFQDYLAGQYGSMTFASMELPFNIPATIEAAQKDDAIACGKEGKGGKKKDSTCPLKALSGVTPRAAAGPAPAGGARTTAGGRTTTPSASASSAAGSAAGAASGPAAASASSPAAGAGSPAGAGGAGGGNFAGRRSREAENAFETDLGTAFVNLFRGGAPARTSDPARA